MLNAIAQASRRAVGARGCAVEVNARYGGVLPYFAVAGGRGPVGVVYDRLVNGEGHVVTSCSLRNQTSVVKLAAAAEVARR